MGLLAPVLGFLAFLRLLPARQVHLDIDYADRPREPDHHSYTHLGWQDVLGPLSCSRWGAAATGVAVALPLCGFPAGAPDARWMLRRRPAHEAART